MARALYPPVLDKLGLAQALQATLGTLPAVQDELAVVELQLQAVFGEQARGFGCGRDLAQPTDSE